MLFDQALEVLERCRIRWGRVAGRSNGALLVESQPLSWDGQRLQLGPLRVESVDAPIGNSSQEVAAGDLVAMHWNYACQRITTRQLGLLRHYHDRHLAIANRSPIGRRVES